MLQAFTTCCAEAGVVRSGFSRGSILYVIVIISLTSLIPALFAIVEEFWEGIMEHLGLSHVFHMVS